MKKIFFIACLVFGFSQTSNAQIEYGIKGGLNYNNNGDATFTTVGNDALEGGEAKSGFHAGLFFKVNLPIAGMYIRPEVVYTQVKSEYAYKTITTDYDFKKIDVPVLIGTSFLGFGNVFVGPSFQYIIEDSFKFSNIESDEFDKFSIGLQTGFGVEFGRLGLDVRWERGLSASEAKFVDKTSNTDITVDNRTNQIIIGLSLQL